MHTNGKSLKVNRLSLEDNPTRDVQELRAALAKTVDVRYMKNLLNFTDRLRSSKCNQQQCPTMRQRLNKHIHDYHSPDSIIQGPPGLHNPEIPIEVRDEGVTVTSIPQTQHVPTFISPQTSAYSAQTDLTSADLSRLDFIQKHYMPLQEPVDPTHRTSNPDMAKETDNTTIKISETRSVIPEKSFYKEHLKDISADWLKVIPMHPSNSDKDKELQENVVNELVERIYNLAVDASNRDYEVRVKLQINDCLNKLPVRYPDAIQDEIQFTASLGDNLWKKIKELNRKYLVNTDTEVIHEVNLTEPGKLKNINNCRGLNTLDSKVMVNSYINVCDLNAGESGFEKEIIDWLSSNFGNENINRFQVARSMMRRLAPLMNESLHNARYKLSLKGKIFEVLDGLPLNSKSVQNRFLYSNRCAEDVANIIISRRIRTENKPKTQDNTEQNSLKARIEKVNGYLGAFKMAELVDIEEEISSLIIDENESSHNDYSGSVNEYTSISLNENKTNISKHESENASNIVNDEKDAVEKSLHAIIPQLTRSISIYTSKEYPFTATSTPKKIVINDIPRLNAEETAYMEKVADLIRTWIDTLPKNYNEDINYKETIINDLAGDIMDELKLKQLLCSAIVSDVKSSSDEHLKYITFRWLCKFDFFEDLQESKSTVNDFLNKLNKLPKPKLTKPQHGNRQTMKNIKHVQGEMCEEDFVPQGIDVLEDQISVWMNKQPSNIYAKKDKAARNKQVHDLALTLQDRLRNKSPDSEIERDINQWLNNILKSKEKEHIGTLTENLKEKIINVPQDQTLESKARQRKRERIEYLGARRQPQTSSESRSDIQENLDKTMKEFIMKFIEHNYDVGDPMARGAFSHLLKIELRKLNPQTRKDVYDNLSKSAPHERFSPFKLSIELEYIKIISDWLKNIPIDASYNTVDNRKRVDFVNDLAKNISEAEDQRSEDPLKMDYDVYIASVISQSIRTYELPILPEHKKNEKLMVDQLMNKINIFRASNTTQNSDLTDSSITGDTSKLQEHNISEFIEQYVCVNGREVAGDEIKLEAWSARLLKEIKKMIHENEDPNTLCKAQVYDRFADLPIPGDESVNIFGLELEYVKEITEWLKNLPLLPIDNQPIAQQERIEMVSELAEKITERTVKKAANPDDASIDTSTVDYIANWITTFPLDKRQEILIPIVTQQLIKRIDKVNKKSKPTDISVSYSVESKKKNELSKTPKERKPYCCNKSLKDPGDVIVEAIEHFSNKLPIQGDKEATQTMKDNIAKKLYQKIGELNADPRIFNDDFLYQELLEDEIDTQLENILQNTDLQTRRDKLKTELVDTIMDAKSTAKANAAGENYKQKLETTIDASFPNPAQTTQEIDPGFEIYKNNLANIFILENFDYGNDEIKAKYENKIKDEIDKYFQNAQNKNSLPLTKDQLYNELYSALYKIPIPCGRAVTDEVEEVKTRCEIQTWLDDLPLKDANDMAELLDRDQILNTLAKRIHETEKESKPSEKIHKEITKWLNKLPLLPGQEKNIDEFAKKLQNILKSTTAVRKRVATELNRKDASKVKKSKGILGTSQVAGPSSAGQNWVTPLVSPEKKQCCAKEHHIKPGDVIIEVVENWCKQIPSTPQENKALKDNLSINIIMKIGELVSNPKIFDNDMIYFELLGDELDKLLYELSKDTEFLQSVSARKHQLIEMLKPIKPLIKEERAKHEYKEDLKNTVNSILEEPPNTEEDKLVEFNDLKNDIVENFVQYNYNRDNEKGRQLYKKQVHDAVLKYFMDFQIKSSKEQDPLIVRNKLLCELSKIPIPSIEALKETVEEIKMKNEVEEFFESLPRSKGDIKKDSLRKQMKVSLAKRLNDIESSGQSLCSDNKMKSEISRCLKKLGEKVKPEVIDTFVDKLKSNKESRRDFPSPKTITLFTPSNRTRPSNYDDFKSGVSMNSSSYPQVWGDKRQQFPICRTIPQNRGGHASTDPNWYPSVNNHNFKNAVPFNPTNCFSNSGSGSQLLVGSTPELETSQISDSQRSTNQTCQGPGRNWSSPGSPSRQYPSSTGPAPNSQFFRTYVDRPTIDKEFSPTKRPDKSLGQSDIDYEDFSGQVIFKSSLRPANNRETSLNQTPSYGLSSPYCTITRDSDMTSSSLFTTPHASQIKKLSRFEPGNLENQLGINQGNNILSEESPNDKEGARYPIANPDLEAGVCSCVKRVLRSCKGRPHCIIDLNEYCEECGGFSPMWWRIFPGYIFY